MTNKIKITDLENQNDKDLDQLQTLSEDELQKVVGGKKEWIKTSYLTPKIRGNRPDPNRPELPYL